MASKLEPTRTVEGERKKREKKPKKKKEMNK
jgi:hypothetical protein